MTAHVQLAILLPDAVPTGLAPNFASLDLTFSYPSFPSELHRFWKAGLRHRPQTPGKLGTACSPDQTLLSTTAKLTGVATCSESPSAEHSWMAEPCPLSRASAVPCGGVRVQRVVGAHESEATEHLI